MGGFCGKNRAAAAVGGMELAVDGSSDGYPLVIL